MPPKRSAPEILAITNLFPPVKGGATTYTYNAILGMPFQVLVLCPFGSDQPGGYIRVRRIFYTNFQIRNRYLRKLYSVCLYLQVALLPLIWAFRYRKSLKVVVCFQVLPAGIVGCLIRLIFGIPYVVVTYGEELTVALRKRLFGQKLRTWLMRVIFSDAVGVATISEFTRGELAHFGADQKKIFLIRPGVCVPRPPLPSKRILQMLNGRGLSERRMILMVGRLIERKGFDNAIRAFAELKREYQNLCLAIVGIGENGTFTEEFLRNLARETTGGKDVLFFGEVSDEELHYLYSTCEMFLLPARTLEDGDTEGFGIVFIEAGAHDKPVIGGKAGAVPEAVVDGETGLLVDGTSTAEIGSAIRTLLENPDLALRLGREGRRRVEREFSIERQQQEFCRMITKLLGQTHG